MGKQKTDFKLKEELIQWEICIIKAAKKLYSAKDREIELKRVGKNKLKNGYKQNKH